MAVKSISIRENITVYPAIMHYCEPSDESELILLMTDERIGTIIGSANPEEIGTMYRDWNPEDCKLYNGTITLSNQ